MQSELHYSEVRYTKRPNKKGTQPGAFSISRTDNGYFALTYPKMASAKNTMSGAIISMLKFISSL